MPTLALVIILAVMPMIIKMMAIKVEKQPTKSAVDFSLGTKYYCFQFFIIFFFNTIIGAASSGKAEGDDLPMVSLYNELSDDPSQITQWLSDAIPQQACSSILQAARHSIACTCCSPYFTTLFVAYGCVLCYLRCVCVRSVLSQLDVA